MRLSAFSSSCLGVFRSNAALQQVLSTTLLQALELLRGGEPWVENRPQANAKT